MSIIISKQDSEQSQQNTLISQLSQQSNSSQNNNNDTNISEEEKQKQIQQQQSKNSNNNTEQYQQKYIIVHKQLTIDQYPVELERNFEIIQNTENKDIIRQAFITIHTIIKQKTEYFNMRAPYGYIIEKMVGILNDFFIKYKHSYEFYKGLIFLSNMILWIDKAYSQIFLMTNPQLLLQLSGFYQENYPVSSQISSSNNINSGEDLKQNEEYQQQENNNKNKKKDTSNPAYNKTRSRCSLKLDFENSLQQQLNNTDNNNNGTDQKNNSNTSNNNNESNNNNINNNKKNNNNNQNLNQQQDMMNEYSLLALIAQLLHQTQRSSDEVVQEIRQTLIEKKFIKKILQYDIAEIDDSKRRGEVSKILSLMLIFFVKHKEKLQDFGLLGQTKTFLLVQIHLNSDLKVLCNFLSCLHYICEPQSVAKFTQAELIKYKIVDKIISSLKDCNNFNLIWYIIRLLKYFLKFPKLKSQMLNLGVVKMMFGVFRMHSRFVAQFFEELLGLQNQEKDFLQKKPYFDLYKQFVYSNIQDPTLKKEDFKYLLKIIRDGLREFSTEQTFNFLQGGLVKMLWGNFPQQEIRSKEILLEIVEILLKNTDSINIDGRPYVLIKLETMDFEHQIRSIYNNQQFQFNVTRIGQIVKAIYEHYYYLPIQAKQMTTKFIVQNKIKFQGFNGNNSKSVFNPHFLPQNQQQQGIFQQLLNQQQLLINNLHGHHNNNINNNIIELEEDQQNEQETNQQNNSNIRKKDSENNNRKNNNINNKVNINSSLQKKKKKILRRARIYGFKEENEVDEYTSYSSDEDEEENNNDDDEQQDKSNKFEKGNNQIENEDNLNDNFPFQKYRLPYE